MSIWGSVISAVSSARRDRRNQRLSVKQDENMARNSLRWRVEDAKRAGIHPLAALGMPFAQSSGLPMPVNATDYGFGEAIQGKQRRQVEKKQTDLIDAQIRESNARAALTEVEAQSQYSDFVDKQRQASALSRGVANQNVIKDNPPEVTTITTPAGRFKTSATTRAQEFEDEYSDIPGNIYGLWRFMNDAFESFKRRVNRKHHHRVMRELVRRKRSR